MEGATPKAVLFDMTGTLHPQADFRRATGVVLAMIGSAHGGLSPETCGAAFSAGMKAAMAELGSKPFYLTTELFALGARHGFASIGVSLDDAGAKSAVATLLAEMAASITPFPGTHRVLQTLRSAGIATAIVSVNDEAPLQAFVDTCGFRPHLDLILSSEAAQSCKPDPRIFQLALERLGVDAADALFVGDMPEMDIVGAKAVGMRTVLTTEDPLVTGIAQDLGEAGVADHTIAAIDELLGLLGLE